MSLFGTSPPQSTLPTQSKSSLFDEEAPTTRSSGGLFSDDANTSTDNNSPWSMPNSKRASRVDLVKTLLPASSVPESYVNAYDSLVGSEYRAEAGKISMAGVKKVLQSAGIGESEQDAIVRIVTGGTSTSAIGRNEFNVLFALVGLAQEGEETSLDSVDERRKTLPSPSVPVIAQLSQPKSMENGNGAQPGESTPNDSPGKSRRLRKDSLENLEADPWASPATGKAQTNPVRNDATPSVNSITAVKPTKASFTGPTRTTSAFTTGSTDPDASDAVGGAGSGVGSNPEAGAGWGSLGGTGAGQVGIGGGGFGSGGDDQGNSGRGAGLGRSMGGSRMLNSGAEEMITVALLPEKEGMFLFQHHNYEVKSSRRGSTVVRRYSDFVWLLDCLHKRYPFRQLPLLPPKRVAVNGRHLAADGSFIEKRRRGLVRFCNSLVRHPVLSKEQLVLMFLTVPTELAVWRKQASISVQEEFVNRVLPPELEESLPTNLADIFDTVRSGVRQSAEQYIALCSLLERLNKRGQGIAADYLRFSQGLSNLTEATSSTYALDVNDVPLLNGGISSVAKHLDLSHSLLEDESRAWDEGVLEDFKQQRDNLVSVRDMFDRRDRYARDNIPQLERRIEVNENKLSNLLAGPGGKPGEQEKLEQAVKSDKQSIIDQHARGVFIKECVRDELTFFQSSQYQVSRLHQEWAQERVKYAELQADNWRRLNDEVDHMPLGD